MVSALFLIVAGLGGAFALGFFRKDQVRLAWLATAVVLALMAAVAVSWTVALATRRGRRPSISPPPARRRPSPSTSASASPRRRCSPVITAAGFLSALSMRDALIERGQRAMAVLLVLIMALSGLVMTRDVFNLFVFVELIVIASAGLVLLSENRCAVTAGFKYLIVSQVISILLLDRHHLHLSRQRLAQYRRHRRPADGLLRPVAGAVPGAHRAPARAEAVPRQRLGARHLRGRPSRLLGALLRRLGHRRAVRRRQARSPPPAPPGCRWRPASGY